MGQPPIQELWQLAQENQRKLQGCPSHKFNCDLSNDELRRGIHRRLTCLECGGLMLVIDVFHYCRGYKAAGGDPNEVLTNFE